MAAGGAQYASSSGVNRVVVRDQKTCKMKQMMLVALCALLAAALAAPQQQYTTPIPIIRLQNDARPDGSYQFSYETGNGIQAEEQGQLENAGNPELEAMSSRGSFSYTGPDGVRYAIQYTADQNGFLAQGEHLPTPPPIPPELQKAFEEASRLPDPNDGGQYQPQLYGNPGRR